MDWSIIALGVLGILSIVFAVKWRQVAHLLKEIGEVCFTTSEAMEDNKIIKEEAKNIFKELVDVILAGHHLFSK